MQSQTPLKSSAIKQGLKQGMGLDQLQQMGTLGQVNAKSLRRLTKMGLSGDDILKLQGMGGQPQQAPQAQNHAQPTGQAGNMDRFFASPDYQFRRDEGQRGIGNSFAARGGAASGNALKALTEFNSNLASGEFGNYYNRLAGMAGMGSQATGNVAGAGNNYANALMGSQQAAGDARASGVMGGANSVMQGVNTGVNAYLWGKYMGGGQGAQSMSQQGLVGRWVRIPWLEPRLTFRPGWFGRQHQQPNWTLTICAGGHSHAHRPDDRSRRRAADLRQHADADFRIEAA
jgi:hypothetical protein